MVSPTKILSVKRKLRHVSPNYPRNDARLEASKRRYVAEKSNKTVIAKKAEEHARVREMKKLSNELKNIKGEMSHAQRMLRKMIRSAKAS